MKLIDLDKALAEAEDECRMSDDWKVAHEMMNVFKYQPIIKAIPIEWIEMFMQRYKIEGGNEYKLLHFMVTEWKKWEKANEREIDRH